MQVRVQVHDLHASMNRGTETTLSVRFSERCCGDPGDCADRCVTRRPLCVCDPDLLKVEVFDLRCPSHGLAATLRECVTADRAAAR